MHGAMWIICYKPRTIIISIWYSYSQKGKKKKSLSVCRLHLLFSPLDIEVLEPGTWCCLILISRCTLRENKIGLEIRKFMLES